MPLIIPPSVACYYHLATVVKVAIKIWTRHHGHIAHHVSSSEEEKTPPGHYKEHTSRSIIDILGYWCVRGVL
jgi:hypothetical protein